MLFRLVRPMKRKGSSKHQFVQRIPADIMERVRGMKLHVPLGDETVVHRVSPKANSMRLSLRTSYPGEVKSRQAQVAGYLESVWKALRSSEPTSLTNLQAVALSKELYTVWVKTAMSNRAPACRSKKSSFANG